MPRATTAACEVFPPRAVRIPSAAIMPSRSSGLVSLRTSTTCSPRSAHALAVGESNTARPTAAPGEAAIPLVSSSRAGRPVELREHQQRQLRTGDPRQRLVHRDQVLVDQLPGDPERRRRGALPDPGLQHPQLAALDGELDIAQVPVVRLQPAHHLHQLLVRRRVQRLEIVQRQGVPDPGDDILALRIGQVVPVHAGSARTPGPG